MAEFGNRVQKESRIVPKKTQGRPSTRKGSQTKVTRRQPSNRRPPAWEATILTTSGGNKLGSKVDHSHTFCDLTEKN